MFCSKVKCFFAVFSASVAVGTVVYLYLHADDDEDEPVAAAEAGEPVTEKEEAVVVAAPVVMNIAALVPQTVPLFDVHILRFTNIGELEHYWTGMGFVVVNNMELENAQPVVMIEELEEHELVEVGVEKEQLAVNTEALVHTMNVVDEQKDHPTRKVLHDLPSQQQQRRRKRQGQSCIKWFSMFCLFIMMAVSCYAYQRRACMELGLSPFCSRGQVKHAYRRLVLKYHPDKIPHVHAGDPEYIREANRQFMRIQEAYESLR